MKLHDELALLQYGNQLKLENLRSMDMQESLLERMETTG